MQLSEYLEVGKKMKTARANAGMSQRDMAIKLSVSNSAYSNYENGYSEPPAEIIIKFCDVLDITLENLLELKVATSKSPTVKTFSQRENQLMAHLSLDIKNAQLATFIPDWNSANKKLASGLIDELEYANWLEDILRIFNVTIDDFI